MLFPFRYGLRKAQERLFKLHLGKKLLRCRLGDGSFVYYTGRRPRLMEHLLAVNWVRIWIARSCRSWEVLHSFSYEDKYDVLRTDGFAAVKNNVTGRYRFMFLELDRDHNPFDKVVKYCRLYEGEGYTGRWWAQLPDRFPPILVVTTSSQRAERIKGMVEAQNSAGLEFRVKLLDDIKKEVVEKCCVG